ncbi:unnamed protein product [Protopolystoma xenopodis]|uniref:Uncharacterized protein n=1 Tax=Protopolystoma xenopodis TaxID=117903 RepID=A0A448XM84_9PLAT|nr:unnamed protein product [Protopolystoma xenopodis]
MTLQSAFGSMLLVPKTALTQFLGLSRRFRARQLTATTYLDGLAGLLHRYDAEVISDAKSHSSLSDDQTTSSQVDMSWLAEMITLLPDVGLQRALLRVLLGEGAARLPNSGDTESGDLPNWLRQQVSKMKRPRAKAPPSWAKGVIALVTPCRFCGQVVLRRDLKMHTELANH